ncbi:MULTISPECIES: response regulator [unclassified Rhizobium]|uniref:response regulator n=1 Tax=unclassified Rhizobium TaxID=2613769 RepID=UPI0024688B4E|nr:MULTISPECIES: response regulator [unclassified Rhizobium]
MERSGTNRGVTRFRVSGWHAFHRYGHYRMNILIVEDELLIALDLESIVEDLGHTVIGPARTLDEALELAEQAEVALVDVQLADGVTGPAIAERLSSEHGVTVVFVTGNPEMVRNSRSAVGVVSKPHWPEKVSEALDYAAAIRFGKSLISPRFLMPLAS